MNKFYFILFSYSFIFIPSSESITEISKSHNSLVSPERFTNYEESLTIKNLNAYNKTDTKIYLKWDISKEDYTIKGYNIDWSGKVLWTTDKTSSGKSFTTERQAVMFSLIPYTSYSVKVTIVYSSGEGSSAEISNVITLEGEPGSPENVFVHVLSSSKIYVNWTDPLEANGKLLNYSLVHLKLSDEEESTKTFNTTRKHIQIYRLYSCGEYEIGVQASTKESLGRQALSFFETNPDSPPKVKRIHIIDLSSRTANLTWDPLPTRCPFNYSLEIQSFTLWNNKTDNREFIFPGEGSSLFMEDLTPWTSYSVCISAVSDIGQSSFTCVDFETLEDVPGSPANLTVDERDTRFTSLTIGWSAPVIRNGEILHFRLIGNNRTKLVSYEGPDVYYKQTFDELEQGQRYFFEVSARTKAGYGLPSQTTAETLRDYHVAVSLGITLFVFLTCFGLCFGCYFRNKLKAKKRRKKRLEAESQIRTRF
ncbi:UNVERIFIED_CONTAM: hypothetical protein RMT77_010113 [Armadillidium vulgare]